MSSFPSPGVKYIQCPLRHTGLPSVFSRLRGSFELKTIPARADFRITGCTFYTVFVNGRFVGRGPLVSGARIMTYDEFPVRDFLRVGKNIVAIHYVMLPYGLARLNIAEWQGGGICADLMIENDQCVLVSDAAWKADLDRAYRFDSATRNLWRSLLEIYDARNESLHWKDAEYNDGDWLPARSLGPGVPQIHQYEPRPKPYCEYEIDEKFNWAALGKIKWLRQPEEFYWFADHRAYQTLPLPAPVAAQIKPKAQFSPITLTVDETAAWHFRLMAQEYVLGRPFFEIEAEAGITVDLIWHEKMRKGDAILDPMEVMANWARYITRAGRQHFTFFDIQGFKELEFIIQPGRPGGKITFSRIGAERQWTMRCTRGNFVCSDNQYALLWKAAARTAACITTDHHCDNSFREQGPWSGDQEWTKMGVYVSEGVHPVTERQFRQFLLGQTEHGRFRSSYPSKFTFSGTNKQGNLYMWLPDHALGYICALWRHYCYSGNIQLLAEAWPYLERQIRHLDQSLAAGGLLDLNKIEDAWIWIDWIGLKDKTTPLNGLWGGALWTMIRIAEVLNKDVNEYRQRHQNLRETFIKTFWDADKNVFLDLPLQRPELGDNKSQLTQSFAACFDLLPAECDRKRLAQTLTALDGQLGIATPPMQGFIFSALEPLDGEEFLHALIRKQWLHSEILEIGTVPEFWPDTPGHQTRSLCQGGSPAIAWAMSYYILGIRPVKPGFAEFSFKPNSGPLLHCRGTVPTPHGNIQASWKIEAGKLISEINAPEGARLVGNKK